MLQDTPELRKLVATSDLCAVRHANIEIESREMVEQLDPRIADLDRLWHDADLACIKADRELRMYLLQELNMKSAFDIKD